MADSDEEFYAFLRRREGFNPRAYNDYKQMSIGYGTRARPGETSISREEAESRLREEAERARSLVQGFGALMTPQQERALTSLTYNAGTKWMNSGLGQAVKAGDWEAAADRLRQYNKAGGQVLPGLQSRRDEEASWITGRSGGRSMYEPMGVGLGGLQPAPAGTRPEELTQQWGSFLQNPKMQAALLAAGVELMKPRWSGASALPDAIGAAGRTVAASEEDDRTRLENERKLQIGLSEKDADRDTKLTVAGIGAQSREEVAQLRAAAMLENTRTRGQLKGPVTEKLRQAYINQYIKVQEAKANSLPELGKARPSPEQVLQDAARWADEELRKSGIGQLFDGPWTTEGPDAGDKSSANRPRASGEGGSIGDTKRRSEGPLRGSKAPDTKAGLHTSRDVINRFMAAQPGNAQAKLERLKEVFANPAALADFQKQVKDPDKLRETIDLMLKRMR